MRAESARRRALAACALAAALLAARLEGDARAEGLPDGDAPADVDPTDPTVARPVAPAPVPDVPPASLDPCDADPRCRLARFREERARARRAEYLRRVDEAGRAMDQRILKNMPWRTRYRYDVDLLLWSNWGMGGVVLSVAPTWWMRLEGYVGYFNHTYNDYQPSPGLYGSVSGDGVHAGSQIRVLPIKWALSPYASIGWGYLTGAAHANSYGGVANSYSYSDGTQQAHLLTAGAGLELIVPWFHCAVGYQLAWSFFAEGHVDNVHDDALTKAVHANLDDAMHGVNVELGVAF